MPRERIRDKNVKGILYESDIREVINGIDGNGVNDGCEVTFNSGMTVTVSGGGYLIDMDSETLISANITLNAANASYDRWDIITLRVSGVVDKITGTADTEPEVPITPEGHLKIADILVPANSTVISPTNIYDARIMLSPVFGYTAPDIVDIIDVLPDPVGVITLSIVEEETEYGYDTWIHGEFAKVLNAGGYVLEFSKWDNALQIPIEPITTINISQPPTGIDTVTFEIADLIASTWYCVRAASYSMKGTMVAWSDYYSIQTGADNSPPPQTGTLTATGTVNGVMLEWTYGSWMSVLDFDHFNVYVGTTSPPTVVEFTTSTWNATWRMSSSDTYTLHYFAVTSVDKNGNESIKSNIASATPSKIVNVDIGPSAVDTENIMDAAITGTLIDLDTISSTNLKSGCQPFNSDIAFTPRISYTHDQITYTSGTIRFADGGTQSITGTNISLASATGVWYIYFTVGSTSLTATQTYSNCQGDTKGLLAMCNHSTDTTQSVLIFPYYSKGLNIQADAIAANSITASLIQANAITADKILSGAITTEKLFVYSILLDGITWGRNGISITWSAGTVRYKGVSYTITSGSTSEPYVYWDKNNTPTTFLAGASKPAWTEDRYILAYNTGSENFVLWNATHIHGGQIITDSITALEIKANTITSTNLATATINGVGGEIYRVVSRGNYSTTQPIDRGLYNARTNALISQATRSYRLSIYDRVNKVWVSHTNYDVYGAIGNADSMATAISALGSDKIIVIHTYDEPQTNRYGTANSLLTQILRCGGSREVFGSGSTTTNGSFKKWSAYILVGIVGCGEGNGMEMYAGDADSSTSAWCDATFTINNGNLDITGGRSLLSIAADRINISGTVYLSSWSHSGDTTKIDGGDIYTRSITASQIAANTITANEIALSTITGSNLVGQTVTATQIANATITGTQIAGSTITGAKIASTTITGDKIALTTITGANLVDGTITGSEIASTTITAGNIALKTITAAQVGDGAITGTNIASTTIGAGHIVLSSITGNQIANTTITGGKIATNTITASNIVTTELVGLDIRTASGVGATGGPAGVRINSSGVYGYSGGTTAQFYLRASDGCACAMGGNLVMDTYGITLSSSSGAGLRFGTSYSDIKAILGYHSSNGVYILGGTGTIYSISLASPTTETISVACGTIRLSATTAINFSNAGPLICTTSAYMDMPCRTSSTLPTGYRGRMFYNTTTNRFVFHNGTEWRYVNTDSGY